MVSYSLPLSSALRVDLMKRRSAPMKLYPCYRSYQSFIWLYLTIWIIYIGKYKMVKNTIWFVKKMIKSSIHYTCYPRSKRIVPCITIPLHMIKVSSTFQSALTIYVRPRFDILMYFILLIWYIILAILSSASEL